VGILRKMKMGKIIFVLLILLPTIGVSQDIMKGYEVLLDRTTSRVGEGKCLVYGNVKDINGNPITSGLVVTRRYEKKTKIKPDGSFSFVVSDKDSMVFVLATNHAEVSITHKFRSAHKVKLTVTTHFQAQDLPEKPVIYLYSESKKEVSINLQPKNGFLFTYPAYENGWLVEVDASRGITQNGKSFPYLFWEGQKQKIVLERDEEDNQLLGAFIKTDTVISFLENQLSSLGLNRREATDFITYWGPRLSNKPFAFVQFMEKDTYNHEIASIQINPQPESMQRVFMVFQGFSDEFQFDSSHIKKQVFKPFERKGFTVIEWGGAELKEVIQI